MDDETRVLQQRVEIAAVGGRRKESFKGVGAGERKQQKASGDQPHHTQHAERKSVREFAAQQRNGEYPSPQHQHPQQQRALVASPNCGQLIVQRQAGIGMAGDIQHREIVIPKSITQRPIRQQQQHK